MLSSVTPSEVSPGSRLSRSRVPRVPWLLLITLSLATLSCTSNTCELLVPYSVPVTTASSRLTSPSGSRVVALPGGALYLVYEEDGHIYFTRSSDGRAWAEREDVSQEATMASQPALAVDAEGTVGVVFVGRCQPNRNASTICYAFKRQGGPDWSTPFAVAEGGYSDGEAPAIAASGSTAHIVWNTGIAILYTKFPTSAPTSTPPGFVGGPSLCAVASGVGPATISAAPGSSEVQVAWYAWFREEGCSNSLISEIRVQRSEGTSFTAGTAFPIPRTDFSFSLAAVSQRNFLLAVSIPGRSAMLYQGDTNNGPMPSLEAPFSDFDQGVQVHLTAGDGTFRLAWSEVRPGSAELGPTYYRDGAWELGAPEPQWATPARQVLTRGRSPQAVQWGACAQKDVKCDLSVVSEIESAPLQTIQRCCDTAQCNTTGVPMG